MPLPDCKDHNLVGVQAMASECESICEIVMRFQTLHVPAMRELEKNNDPVQGRRLFTYTLIDEGVAGNDSPGSRMNFAEGRVPNLNSTLLFLYVTVYGPGSVLLYCAVH